MLADVVPVESKAGGVPMSCDDGSKFTRFGQAVFELGGRELALAFNSTGTTSASTRPAG